MQFLELKRSVAAIGVAASALLAAGAAQAGVATLSLDVGGAQSIGTLGDANNEVRTLDIGAGVHIIGLSWNVSLASFGASWLSEMGLDLSAADGSGLSLFPALGDDNPGSGSYSGSFDLEANGLDFFLGMDGRLTGRFFEFYDDAGNGAADGVWRQGAVTVTYVPEPASYALAALGLFGIAALRRRA